MKKPILNKELRGVKWVDIPNSSNLKRIAHSVKTNIMYVEYLTDLIYRFEGVDAIMFETIRNADSAGKLIRQMNGQLVN